MIYVKALDCVPKLHVVGVKVVVQGDLHRVIFGEQQNDPLNKRKVTVLARERLVVEAVEKAHGDPEISVYAATSRTGFCK
jgi:hypothetical protein